MKFFDTRCLDILLKDRTIYSNCTNSISYPAFQTCMKIILVILASLFCRFWKPVNFYNVIFRAVPAVHLNKNFNLHIRQSPSADSSSSPSFNHVKNELTE